MLAQHLRHFGIQERRVRARQDPTQRDRASSFNQGVSLHQRRVQEARGIGTGRTHQATLI
eukprot:247897-Ditylum_brightwellii.AAC.1